MESDVKLMRNPVGPGLVIAVCLATGGAVYCAKRDAGTAEPGARYVTQAIFTVRCLARRLEVGVPAHLASTGQPFAGIARTPSSIPRGHAVPVRGSGLDQPPWSEFECRIDAFPETYFSYEVVASGQDCDVTAWFDLDGDGRPGRVVEHLHVNADGSVAPHEYVVVHE